MTNVEILLLLNKTKRQNHKNTNRQKKIRKKGKNTKILISKKTIRTKKDKKYKKKHTNKF